MQTAIETIKNELADTERLFENYINSGNPMIELFIEDAFQKRIDLIAALELLEKYNVPVLSCNLSLMKLDEYMSNNTK